MSLVGSIFGQKEETTDSSLSNLFEEKELPEKPQHKALAPRTRTKKKKRKEKAAEKDDDGSSKEEDEEPKNKKLKSEDENVDDRTIFVGNLPLDTTRKSLANMFKSCGKVSSCRLRSLAVTGVKLPTEHAGNQALVQKVCANTHKLDSSAKSTAQGYVVFSSKESVEQALKLNNTVVEGLHIRVDHATPTMDASRTVFCGNLPYQAEEATLQEHFVNGCGLQHEDVEGVRIIRDKETMQCKGFGYVLFREKSMVATALQKMHESKYMKRDLRVTVCGKRFKGKRGNSAESKRRNFEGKRSDAAAQGAVKRILGKKTDDKEPKKRRARGDTKKKKNATKSGPKKAGVSKRAAAEAKAGKRMKKIQKRVSKGMGKARK